MVPLAREKLDEGKTGAIELAAVAKDPAHRLRVVKVALSAFGCP